MGREVEVPMRQPLDPKRGGSQTKVAVLLCTYQDKGWRASELREFAGRFQDALDERRDTIESGTYIYIYIYIYIYLLYIMNTCK